MPSKNSKKLYDSNTYYHVYNRGVDKKVIFHDEQDYDTFVSYLKRYTGKEPVKDSYGREYEWLGDQVEIVSYCLMPNHFHLLLFVIEPTAMTALLRGVCGAYTVYYNKRYARSGTLLQGVYKASRITHEAYLQHITRYIHRNPKNVLGWEWSSVQSYIGEPEDWIHSERLIDHTSADHSRYKQFLFDSYSTKEQEELIESMLANR